MVWLFIIRYGVNAVLALELFIVPLLLNPAYYSTIEYTRNAAALAQFSMMGAYTGYVYKFYQERADHFRSLLLSSAVVGLLTGIGYGIVFKSFTLGVAAVCVVLSVVLEKKLQVYRCFVHASLFKAICSVSLICVAYAASRSLILLPAADLFGLAIVASFLVWSLLCFRVLKTCSLGYHVECDARFSWQSVMMFVRKGFILNLATQFLSYYLFFDRFYVTREYASYVSGYSLAFNVSQLVFVGLNTITFVYLSDIGDKATELSRSFLTKKIAVAAAFLAGLFLTGAGACFIYSSYVHGYHGFFDSYLAIASLFGAYYALSVISSAALFTNTTNHLAVILAVVLALKIGVTKLLFPLLPVGYFQFLVFSGVLLVLAGVVTTAYIFKGLE